MLLDRCWQLAFERPSKGTPLIEAIPKGDIEHHQCYFLFHVFATEVRYDHAQASEIQEDASSGAKSIQLDSTSAHFILEALELALEALSNAIHNMLLHFFDIKRLHQPLCINISFDILHEFVNFWHAIVDEKSCNAPDEMGKV